MALQTGIVGSGIAAENNHLPAVSRNPRTDLVAVADTDGPAAREAVAEYGGRAYTDAGAMFDGERFDWAPNNEIRVHGSEKSATVDVQTNTAEVHDADEGPFHLLSKQLARSRATTGAVVRGEQPPVPLAHSH